MKKVLVKILSTGQEKEMSLETYKSTKRLMPNGVDLITQIDEPEPSKSANKSENEREKGTREEIRPSENGVEQTGKVVKKRRGRPKK